MKRRPAVHHRDPACSAPDGRGGGRPGLAGKVKTLGKVARDVDRLHAAATKLTEQALAAKARADEAEREFQALARELMGAETDRAA